VIVFDLETTGFDPDEDEIIEVGFCVVHDGEVTKESGCLVRPDKTIPEVVERLTGITNEKAQKQGFPWSEVADRWRPYLEEEETWCAYNASFDIGFVEAHFDPSPTYSHIVDPMRIAQRFIPSSKIKDTKLGTVAEFFDVSLRNAHRAVQDAKATMRVVEAMTDQLRVPLDDLKGSQTTRMGPYHIGEDPVEALYSGLPDR